jgi:hypothetical protein
MDERARTEDFTSPRQGRDNLKLPRRNRAEHGADLVAQLDDAEARARADQEGAEIAPGGITLVFRSDPKFELALKSLESSQQGIELLNVRVVGNRSLASVYIPNGKLVYFKNRFEQYLTEVSPTKGAPRHKRLVESISDIQYQAIEAFWTEQGVPLPADGVIVNWEIWLRVRSDPEPILNIFRVEAEHRGLTIGPRVIRFPERVVTLAIGSVEQIRSSWLLLDMIAELRLAKECPTTFIDMEPHEQAEWVRAAVARLRPPPIDAGSICLLDTGVNNGHPLLSPALHNDHVLTCFPKSPKADLIGHGTEMAGLALYGDLAAVLANDLPVELVHRLEAVKIHPEAERPHPDLYGAVCLQAATTIERISPARRRVY